MENPIVIPEAKRVRMKAAKVDWKKVKNMKVLYLMILIPITFLAVFNYSPMYGVLIAFKNFRYVDGILGSDWNNFAYFRQIYEDPIFRRAFWNTLRINIISIVCTFPLPIVFAMLLNEMRRVRYKKIVQTISYLPHFMSWVVIGGFVYQMLSPEIGFANAILSLVGVEPIYFMTKTSLFIPILLSATVWASVGWSSIIYLAAISAIDPGLYESAELDGANRLKKAIYITIPSIIPTITILFILGLAGILSAGFDPIFNLYNPMVMDVADVIDTYVFRKGLQESQFGYAAAVGLFQSVIGIILIYLANKTVKRFSDYGIW
ncbi:ABC transporter permease [Paenibacillus eucommiae]|uniref:Aldouronate transport system permease protein n=1 Tax=Paenibacillus eucommiae TaxID=1355755 RepID=A0ABS4J0R3_9BACL|nr:ABC transporter permease subunit [Paenibacillus eucommiae]MBP1993410.1 putative aldouronate transport system permease protein [Paenibacillus eucommiae]